MKRATGVAMTRLRWLLLVVFPTFILILYTTLYATLLSTLTQASSGKFGDSLEKSQRSKDWKSLGFNVGVSSDSRRETTLEECVRGVGPVVASVETLSIDIHWRGDVVLQVDNRVPDFENTSAWAVKKHVEASLLLNSLVAEDYGAKYLMVRVPSVCLTPHNEQVIRFWCKVPAIRLAAKTYPRARSVLFLDSDAYLNTDPEVGGKLWSNFEFHNMSPLYVGRSTGMQWGTLNEKLQLYREPMNSGAILFHPGSKRVQEVLEWWWVNATRNDYISLVDAFKTSIIVQLHFHPTCPLYTRFKLTGNRNMFGRLRHLLEPFLHPHTKALPLEHFFAPRPALVRNWVDLDKRGFKIRHIRSIKKPRTVVEFRIGHFRDGEEIHRVLHAFDTPAGSLMNNLQSLFGCPVLERKVSLLRPQSMLKQWPGDQERLQSIRERFPQHVKVSDDLAAYDTPSLRLNQSVVFHSCKRVIWGQKLALKYLSRSSTLSFCRLVQRLKSIKTVCMAEGSTAVF